MVVAQPIPVTQPEYTAVLCRGCVMNADGLCRVRIDVLFGEPDLVLTYVDIRAIMRQSTMWKSQLTNQK